MTSSIVLIGFSLQANSSQNTSGSRTREQAAIWQAGERFCNATVFDFCRKSAYIMTAGETLPHNGHDAATVKYSSGEAKHDPKVLHL